MEQLPEQLLLDAYKLVSTAVADKLQPLLLSVARRVKQGIELQAQGTLWGEEALEGSISGVIY